MKKTVLLSILALCIGLIGGLLLNFSAFNGNGLLLRNAAHPLTTSPALTPLSPAATAPPQDLSDNTVLLTQGSAVLEALRGRNYTALETLVHPERGITFTPYSTVDLESDLCFAANQLADLAADGTKYIWGTAQGKGTLLELTFSDYLDKYVYNADYARAPLIGIDQVLASGNALENVSTAYPDDRFIEYYFPGLDPVNQGFDWCSLKLVFAQWDQTYRLVGIIHSEWTI